MLGVEKTVGKAAVKKRVVVGKAAVKTVETTGRWR
jgi:hypothetical protein